MSSHVNSFIENSVQCWGCGVFDRLIQMGSGVASNIYNNFAQICIAVFVMLFTIFVFNAVWQNLKNDISWKLAKIHFYENNHDSNEKKKPKNLIKSRFFSFFFNVPCGNRTHN